MQGHAEFHTTRKEIAPRTSTLHGMAVQVTSGHKFCVVIRFYYQLPKSLSKSCYCWLETPKTEKFPRHLFFTSVEEGMINRNHGKTTLAISALL